VGKNKVSRGAFSEHWETLLATHYQINREEFAPRERKRRRRKRQWIGGITTAVILLLSAALAWALASRNVAVEQRRQAESRLYVVRGLGAQVAIEQQDYIRANEFLEESFPAPGTPAKDDLRSFDWFYRWRQMHEEKATLKGHRDKIILEVITADGRTFPIESGALCCQRVLSVAITADGRTLASSSASETINLWDVASGQKKATLNMYSYEVSTVAFTADGRTLASGSWQGTIKLWDVASGQEKAALKGHAASVSSVAFTNDGRTLASASKDKTVRLWRGATDAEVARDCTRCGRKE
jgi:hypothetical protein